MGKRRQKLCMAKKVSWVSSKSGSSKVDAKSLGTLQAISGWSKEVHANFPNFAGLHCPPKSPKSVFWCVPVESLCSEKEYHHRKHEFHIVSYMYHFHLYDQRKFCSCRYFFVHDDIAHKNLIRVVRPHPMFFEAHAGLRN